MLSKIAVSLACATICTSVSFAQSKGGGSGGIAGAGIAPMTSKLVVSGLVRPIFATYAPGDATRLFIIEKQGRIRVVKIDQNPPVILATAFLDIDSVIAGGTSTSSEQGLLGLAFHPNYQSNGVFFVYYTANSGADTVARFTVSGNPDIANGSSTTGTVLISQPDAETNHNGGWMAFKPGDTQGYLYFSIGDGGGGNDQHSSVACPNGNGQCKETILGKIIRIDIDGADGIPGNDDDDGNLGNASTGGYTNPPTNPYFGATAGLDEIWDYGLRNSWRCSFDRGNGDLYIADVGQNAWEEIDYEPSNSPGGVNYGWRCMEGNNCTGLTGCTCDINCPAGLLKCPIYQYAHGGTPFKCSITGGYVYRGSAIAGLQGTYFFADYNCGQPGDSPIFTFAVVGGVLTNFQDRTTELLPSGASTGLHMDSVTSFGEDLAGEIYVCDQDGGEVFKIIPAPPANDTCAAATLVGNVSNMAFSSIEATTDGPDEPASCNFGGYTQIGNDVWFKYLATCTGTVTVNTCGSSYNTKIAVYGPCPAASGSTLACNDDFCGTSSQVTFASTQNTLYRIRIGGFNGAMGNGLLTISCAAPPPCPGDVNDNGIVDIDDLVLLITNWACTGTCGGDENNNGIVDIDDLVIVITSWGNCP